MENIQLTIDEDLFAQIKHAIEQEKTTLSVFIRESLIHYLNKIKTRELEKQHREGYSKHPVQNGEFDVWEEEQVWVS